MEVTPFIMDDNESLVFTQGQGGADMPRFWHVCDDSHSMASPTPIGSRHSVLQHAQTSKSDVCATRGVIRFQTNRLLKCRQRVWILVEI